jgi:hypothetical protein
MMKRLIPAAAILAAVAIPAIAHHATVMFDSEKEVTLAGTVKEFRYVNPHASIHVLGPREGGQPVEWRIETDSPLVLGRNGIDSGDLQPGEKVTVRARPLKGGGSGGMLIAVTKADGTVLSAPD